ncbi:LCP family protein [Demequina sp.]|uniref:LCP family protein n=1 Tax=Demequina sp. TaxID=2050685 RepID=UPI0025E4D167|nr:LCP family protein [Demequina sp.]
MTETAQVQARHARGGLVRRILWYAALAAAGVAGFVLVYGNTVVDQLDSAYHAQDVRALVGDRPERAGAGTDGPLTILVMGSDVRDGGNLKVGGGSDVQGMRNDTTMLVHVSADRSRVEAVSIPRDAQVEIPACTYLDGSTVPGTTGDFNIAFSHGGARGSAAEAAACTIKTVEQMTGVYIDHYAVVDFTGFIDMVDAIGGVPMCIPERLVSSKAHLDLRPGPQVLDGTTALAYARLRTAEQGGVSGSDLQRITRQQQMLEQVARTVLSKNLLTDVGELTQFIRAGAESLTMDTELADTSSLLALAYSVRGLDARDIAFETVPWAYTEDRLNVRILPEAEQMWDDMRNDRPISVTAEGDASSAWDDGKKDETTSSPKPSETAEPAGSSSATSLEDLLGACR